MADALPLSGWDAHVHVFDAAAPVRAGHYQPRTHSLAEIERLGRPHGIGQVVLVQPSVYGTDNQVLLRALRQSAGRHRGVVVVDATVSDAELDAMDQAGVRGVRFNLVSPVGNSDADLLALAPRLRERAWHVQWYASASQLAHLAALQRRTGLVFVLDHLAGLGVDTPEADPAWAALAELAGQGAWLKLSGWYRLGAAAPYTELVPLIARASAGFGQRLVWGSDWPHTSQPETPSSRHPSLLAPVRAALGSAATEAVLHTYPSRLYGASVQAHA